MPIGRPPVPITLSEGEKEELESMTRSLTLPHGLVRRARIILACAAGEPRVEIAKRLGLSRRSANGAIAFTTRAPQDSMTNNALAAPAPMMTSGWPR